MHTNTKPGVLARSFFCLSFGILGLIPAPSSAQTAAVESLGARKCADLIAAQKGDATLYAGFGVWIGGYLTAANAYEPDTFDLTPWQPVELAAAQITAACMQQEAATIALVTASFVNHLKANRMAEPSPLVRLRNGDKALFVYRSVLANIRAELEQKGATIDDPDGEFGETFGQAILKFQGDNGLAQTGLPDTQTLIELLK